ncbi:hypothetical protein IQ07DRAFT_620291 [Pyrenochaeta sp. DS3sAY3a]|nr:hypothetical protein IQ07DRAFT_620291 [Pyrenochaeta sp. DS3sAY3a]
MPNVSQAAVKEEAGANVPLTSEELAAALEVDVFDREGKTIPLGQLLHDKRTVLIFPRHFWCLNCQAYIRAISEAVPPAKLPSSTQILIISNGSYQPIDTYINTTSSAYAVYTDPTLRLHQIMQFKYALKEESSGEEKKDYMLNAGSTMTRIIGGVKGAITNLQHVSYIGPKSLNGGEVIISKDVNCEYIHRMQNTVDHTSIADLVKLIGAGAIRTPEEPA